MAINELNLNSGAPTATTPAQDSGSVGQRVSGSALATKVTRGIDSDASAVSTASSFQAPSSSASAQSARSTANKNQLISVANVATEATSEIERLSQSLDQITGEATNSEATPEQLKSLEERANKIVSQIKQQANSATPGGIKPLAGDKVQIEVARLSKTLEFLLPDGAKEAFNLGVIQFSPKDSILNTVANVKIARGRIDQLRSSVNARVDQIKRLADEIDVASQNTESSATTLRDVDAAADLATKTGLKIENNPGKALGSIGDLESKVYLLLDN